METTTFDRKKHWETIYQTKQLTEVSWYQPKPETSLSFIKEANLAKDVAIIDIGGGDSFLVDNLLALGYTNITVLDISEAAVNRAKNRLGEKADSVTWIVADVATFVPEQTYALWHDRAAFHFLTSAKEIEQYKKTAAKALQDGGYMIIGTFSENGPLKCSGIEIRQYAAKDLEAVFNQDFSAVSCQNLDHQTPFNTVQNFTFCLFEKK